MGNNMQTLIGEENRMNAIAGEYAKGGTTYDIKGNRMMAGTCTGTTKDGRFHVQLWTESDVDGIPTPSETEKDCTGQELQDAIGRDYAIENLYLDGSIMADQLYYTDYEAVFDQAMKLVAKKSAYQDCTGVRQLGILLSGMDIKVKLMDCTEPDGAYAMLGVSLYRTEGLYGFSIQSGNHSRTVSDLTKKELAKGLAKACLEVLR